MCEWLILTHNFTSRGHFCLDLKKKKERETWITSGGAGVSGGNNAGGLPVPYCNRITFEPLMEGIIFRSAHTKKYTIKFINQMMCKAALEKMSWESTRGISHTARAS